ncbi:GGDEF domain-containing protein [Thermostaphylospora chromogena]|uniref:GGDEF domain-containing protein n=1 Tax=Thermostaphylospora chromogena TaxID=35622 RepID=UPI001F61A441|nr:GGDEF domain-containing protein [Thermostaphylospora chromogena]
MKHRRRLVVYICAVVTLHVTGIVVFAAMTPIRWQDLVTFGALLACGGVCIEATRRLGMPAGVSRDLLSAWWLPVAFLLPPLYALLTPIPLQILIQKRVRQTVLHRRVFSGAAIGLSGGVTSVVFHATVSEPSALDGGSAAPIAAALACALLFSLINTPLIGVAAYMANHDIRWREVLWDRESAILDVVELCVGTIVAILCSISIFLLVLALPPVMLLQRSLLHAQLQAAARTDPKTGLLNVAAWQREAETEIVRARRTGENFALLLIDIDHFKQVNDRHGHLVGDQVLVEVAATLRGQLREYDLVGRFGGEEFVVLLPHTDPGEARQVAERLRRRVGRMSVPVEEGMVRVTVSTGVAFGGVHGDDLLTLLAAADLALYQAKALGRDRVCLPAPRRPGPAEMTHADEHRRGRGEHHGRTAARSHGPAMASQDRLKGC